MFILKNWKDGRTDWRKYGATELHPEVPGTWQHGDDSPEIRIPADEIISSVSGYSRDSNIKQGETTYSGIYTHTSPFMATVPSRSKTISTMSTFEGLLSPLSGAGNLGKISSSCGQHEI